MDRQEVGASRKPGFSSGGGGTMELCCDLGLWQVLLLWNWESDRGRQGALRGTHVSESGSQGRVVREAADVGRALKAESVEVACGTDECEQGVKGDATASGLKRKRKEWRHA